MSPCSGGRPSLCCNECSCVSCFCAQHSTLAEHLRAAAHTEVPRITNSGLTGSGASPSCQARGPRSSAAGADTAAVDGSGRATSGAFSIFKCLMAMIQRKHLRILKSIRICQESIQVLKNLCFGVEDSAFKEFSTTKW